MRKITICIPTYNKGEELRRNLDLLLKHLSTANLGNDIGILVSDNASEGIEGIVNDYSPKGVTFLTSSVNVGPELNFLKAVDYCNTEWVLLLGDDDYLQADYIRRVMSYLDNPDISVILPNFYNVDAFGRKGPRGRTRDKITDDKRYEAGSLRLMFKGHQMSGLVFRKEGVIESYRANVESNYYPMMYFLGFNILRGATIHVTEFPFANTVIDKKAVDYNIDKLMDHVLKNVKALPVSEKQKISLYKYIIRKDTKSRLGNPKSWRHPIKMMQKINDYNFGASIVRFTKLRFLLSYLHFPWWVCKKIIKSFIHGGGAA